MRRDGAWLLDAGFQIGAVRCDRELADRSVAGVGGKARTACHGARARPLAGAVCECSAQ